MSSVLTVDAIQRIVKIVTLLKHVRIAYGKNVVVVGLVYINREISRISVPTVSYKQTTITLDSSLLLLVLQLRYKMALQTYGYLS